MHGNIPYLFYFRADPFAHLPLLKRSMILLDCESAVLAQVVSCCVHDKAKNCTAHAWQHSIIV